MPKVIDIPALFETTVELFAQHGFESTKTQEIARRAGVNETTLFRRFGNKSNLIAKSLSHCLSSSPFAELNASEDARADIYAILAAYQQTFLAYGGAVLTLLNEMPRHTELQAASQALTPNLQKAVNIIAGHQSKNRLRPGNPAHLLSILISPIMMSGMYSRAGSKMDIPPISIDQVAQGFLDGYWTQQNTDHTPTDHTP